MKRLEDFIRIYALAKQKSGDMPLLIIKIAAHNNLKLPEVKERTQLDAVKDSLRKTALENGYKQNHQLWMPVLPTHIYLKATGSLVTFYTYWYGRRSEKSGTAAPSV